MTPLKTLAPQMFPSTYDDAYYTIKNIILNNTAVNESNIYWSSEVRPVLKILSYFHCNSV